MRLEHHGDRTAFIDLRTEPPTIASARQVETLATAVARGLLRDGRTVGERIAILAENRLEFIASYLGVMKAGCVAVPINFRLPAETIAHIFADSQVAMVFADSARRALVPPGVPIRDFDAPGPGGFASFLDHGSAPVVELHDDAVAEILYTSGSTGTPKGVPLTHKGQLWALAQYLIDPSSPPDDVTLVVAPTYHMNGLFSSCLSLANRSTIVSIPRFEAKRYIHAIADHRCTVVAGIPTMFALVARERQLLSQLDFSFVRSVAIGSAPLTGALLATVQGIFPNAVISNGYGTTEAGPAIFGPHPQGLARPPLSIGYPLPDVEWRLSDGNSADEGILWVRTPAMMTGYLNQPAATAERIVDGWYVTGDIMRRDADGFFFYVGRADDMFVCGGENIYPGEVEKLLERHPAVAQAVVVPVPDEIKGMVPVAFVVRSPGVTLNEADVQEHALAYGPAYSHPRRVIFMDDLPVAGTHKIDRAALIKKARTTAFEQAR